MNIIKITQIILFALLLYSCQSAKDALQGKKRSEGSDEFLIEKKNPLTMPPDIDELPVPMDEEIIQNEEDNNKIKELLTKDNKVKSKSSSKSDKNTSVEKTILEQIQD
tara:strand:+ start:481 stop:804 length:324 start_codon:yes stop_codon:yes gene_type:complete